MTLTDFSPLDPVVNLTSGSLNLTSGSLNGTALTGTVITGTVLAGFNQAACSGLGISLFFSDDFDDIVAAKILCLGCPIRGQCLDDAIERGEQYGVWGGQLLAAGRIVIAKRRRGRPSKVARPEDRLPEVAVPLEYQRLVASA